MSKFSKAACNRCGKVFEYGNGLFDKSPRVEGFLFKRVCFDCSEKIDRQRKEENSKKHSSEKNFANDYANSDKSSSDELSKKTAIISLVFFGLCAYALFNLIQGSDLSPVNLLLIFGSIVCAVIYLIFAFSSFFVFLFALLFAISLIIWQGVNDVGSPKSILIASPSASDSNTKNITSSVATSNNTPDKTAENKIKEKSIKDLEDEKEYQGDDPIVRQRLGLPPKESP